MKQRSATVLHRFAISEFYSSALVASCNGIPRPSNLSATTMPITGFGVSCGSRGVTMPCERAIRSKTSD